MQLTATKDTSLDKNNSFDLHLNPGWNTLKSCEIRVKPATGGLRLLTIEATIVGSSIEFAKPPETGIFHFNDVAAETPFTLRFPYTVEQDIGDVSAKVEVSYTVESGEIFFFAKSVVIPISLALGVNVQDVFKHQALYSRFNVSTASSSPLRLFKSELLSSELFESEFGVPPENTIVIFPKQPATLLYRVKRKPDAKTSKRSGKTMHLKLYYSVLQTEIEDLVVASVNEALEQTSLKQYSRLISSCVRKEAKGLQELDSERAALLGSVSTSFLAEVSWERHLAGIGEVPGTSDAASEVITKFLKDWQKSHPQVPIPALSATEASTILIPVEIPSLTILHTADLQLQKPLHSLVNEKPSATPTICINQLIPAILNLKWTQIWDTDTYKKRDPEFSYEVSAPSDTWLVGGRRKGHFIIPNTLATDPVSSAPETEGAIPLVFIPLREGWLPYPNVEIREIVPDEATDGPQACEVDFRNLGETIRVVSERKSVTVSLDASGPGGGPLVLESEGLSRDKGRIIA